MKWTNEQNTLDIRKIYHNSDEAHKTDINLRSWCNSELFSHEPLLKVSMILSSEFLAFGTACLVRLHVLSFTVLPLYWYLIKSHKVFKKPRRGHLYDLSLNLFWNIEALPHDQHSSIYLPLYQSIQSAITNFPKLYNLRTTENYSHSSRWEVQDEETGYYILRRGQAVPYHGTRARKGERAWLGSFRPFLRQ